MKNIIVFTLNFVFMAASFIAGAYACENNDHFFMWAEFLICLLSFLAILLGAMTKILKNTNK